MIRLVSVLAMLAAGAAAAQPVAVFVPRAINLQPQEVEAFGLLCADEYAQVAGVPVVAPADAQKAVGANGSLVDAARALHARELVELTVVSLGERGQPGRLLINGVRRGLDGKELYHADVSAASLDDAVPACERLALSLVREVPVEDTRTRHNVTRAEMRASSHPNRLGTEKVLGLKIGFGAPLASGAELNPLGSISFDARLERDRYFIELGVGLLVPATVLSTAQSYGGLTTELGLSYYLTEGDIAAYVGGGIEPRLITSGSVMNLAPYVQGGLMFWRESSTRLYVDARVAQNVLPAVSTGGGSSGSLYPTELTVQVGVGW